MAAGDLCYESTTASEWELCTASTRMPVPSRRATTRPRPPTDAGARTGAVFVVQPGNEAGPRENARMLTYVSSGDSSVM